MSDFCFGCGRHLDGTELQCPECGRLTDKGRQQGYDPQKQMRKQQGVLYLVMGILLLATAVSMLVMG